MARFDRAQELLHEFKGDSYLYGLKILDRVGAVTAGLGRRAVLIQDTFPGSAAFVEVIERALATQEVIVLKVCDGAAPNAPREDLIRITGDLVGLKPDVVVSFGGGSTVDAAKAAIVLATLGGEIDEYFGAGLVTRSLTGSGKALTPHVAIQTAASSGAHLTKYSNITDLKTGQKKLIVDMAITPARPVFDYLVTLGAPRSLTADGALDGVSHALEVLYSAVGKPEYPQVEATAREAIGMVVEYLPRALESPHDVEARRALGLATDLGGYAIMLGGTNGGHLTSFSLVDILSHGRACAIMNPYYTVFFAPAVEDALRVVGAIYREAGYTSAPIERLRGRELGMAVAEAMITFEQRIGFPATLGEVPGFSEAHIVRALTAAKDPQLKMKLENMPVPLTAEMVDEYMEPILRAAQTGDLSLIKNVT